MLDSLQGMLYKGRFLGKGSAWGPITATQVVVTTVHVR